MIEKYFEVSNLPMETSVFAYYYANNLPLYIYAGVGFINNLTLNSINAFCTLSVNFALKNANYSKQTKDMHRSLVMALVVQVRIYTRKRLFKVVYSN